VYFSTPRRVRRLSRGNQRADFESPRSPVIRSLPLLRREARVCYRGVSGFKAPRSALCPSQKRIAPSRKAGALTPRCSWVLSRGKCVLRLRDPPYALLKSVSRPRKKKGRLRRDAAHGNTPSEKIKPRQTQTKVWRSQGVHENLSLCSLYPPCEPCFSRHVQKRIAPSQKERALTPRRLYGLKIVPSILVLFLDGAL